MSNSNVPVTEAFEGLAEPEPAHFPAAFHPVNINFQLGMSSSPVLPGAARARSGLIYDQSVRRPVPSPLISKIKHLVAAVVVVPIDSSMSRSMVPGQGWGINVHAIHGQGTGSFRKPHVVANGQPNLPTWALSHG